jgi:hypothetical protein
MALITPPLAGGVASLEHHDDAQAFVLDPFLQRAELDLQVPQGLFVVLAIHRLSSRVHGRRAIFAATGILTRIPRCLALRQLALPSWALFLTGVLPSVNARLGAS